MKFLVMVPLVGVERGRDMGHKGGPSKLFANGRVHTKQNINKEPLPSQKLFKSLIPETSHHCESPSVNQLKKRFLEVPEKSSDQEQKGYFKRAQLAINNI